MKKTLLTKRSLAMALCLALLVTLFPGGMEIAYAQTNPFIVRNSHSHKINNDWELSQALKNINGSIQVSWKAYNRETLSPNGYYLYRTEGNNAEETIKIDNITTCSYTDNQVVAGRCYSYKVQPFHKCASCAAEGIIEPINSIDKTSTLHIIAMKKPTLSVKLTDQAIKLSWTKACDKAEYSIYAKTGNGGSAYKGSTNKTSYTYTESLEPDTSYQFYIKATASASVERDEKIVNVSTSIQSDSVTVTTPKKEDNGDNSGDNGGNSGDNSGDNGGNSGDNGGNSGDNGGNSGDNGGNSGDNGGNSGDNGGNSGDNGGNSGDNGGNSGDNGGNSGDNGGNSGDNGGNSGDNSGDNGGNSGDNGGNSGDNDGNTGDNKPGNNDNGGNNKPGNNDNGGNKPGDNNKPSQQVTNDDLLNKDETIKPGKVKLVSAVNNKKGITLTWTKSKNAKVYQIYRKVGKGLFLPIKTIKKPTTLTFTDVNVLPNTSYSYRVYAERNDSVTKSSALSVYRLAPMKLKAAKSNKTRSAYVQWDKNKKVTGYQIKFVYGKKTITKKVNNANKAALTVKSLKKGKRYSVSIRSYKKVGSKTYYSTWSANKKVKIK